VKIRKRTVAWAAAALVILLWIASFFTPEGAIRRYMFLKLHPISAVTSEITDLGLHLPMDGHLYHATKYVSREAGGEIGFFYVKKKGPFWFVESAGSAP